MDRARRKYLEKMIAELRRGGLTDSIDVDEEQFQLVLGGGVVINLHNGFVEWERASVLRRGQVLRRFAEVFLQPGEPPPTVEEARPNLMLRVRDREWYAVNELRFADAADGQGPAFTYEPLNDWLSLEVVYDWPTSVSSLKPETLAGWGMSVEEAIRTGRANLRERTEGTFRAAAPGVFASPWEDTYDAARLVLTELISRLDLRGDPVALLPQRNHLFLAGADDESALGRIAELAEPLLDEPHRVTGRAFVWRDGYWQLFLPPETHPHHERFRRLVTLTVAEDYNEQQAVLEQRSAAAGEDVFVAAVMLRVDNDSGEVRSVCTWTEGVRTMLPRADEIAFVVPGASESDSTITFVPWERALAVLGGHMEPQGLLPERWLVDSFPSPADPERDGTDDRARGRAQHRCGAPYALRTAPPAEGDEQHRDRRTRGVRRRQQHRAPADAVLGGDDRDRSQHRPGTGARRRARARRRGGSHHRLRGSE